MNIFWALILGVLSYIIAHLVFNEVISGLIAIVVAAAIIFGYDGWSHGWRRP